MKLLLCFLALGVIPGSGQVADIALYTQFQHPTSPIVLAALQSEVESLLLPVGGGISWRKIPTVRGDEVSEELAVITFRGICAPEEMVQRPPAGPLGWTHLSDGVVLPFTEVDCDRVRGLIGTALVSYPPGDRSRIFGRAVGRVLAHELYHILARTAHHGSRAVDQPTLTAAELLSDGFDIEGAQYTLLQAVPVAVRTHSPSPKLGKAIFESKGCGTCHGARAEGTRRAPALRIVDGFFTSVVLAAKLGIGANRMKATAKQLKVPPPSLSTVDLADLVSFLNAAPVP